jgi:hypothetical protein
MRLSDKIVLIYDWSYFFAIAQTLSPYFKEIWYYCPRDSNFATIERARIGYGYQNIKCVDEDDVHLNLDKFDLIVFPDVGDGGLAKKWSKEGRPVISSKMGEKLENDRLYFKKRAKEIGLNVNKYEVFTDIDDLADYLRKRNDLYVKISYFRGERESFHFENWKKNEKDMIDLSHKIGPFRHHFDEFLVEEPIQSKIENGTDRLFANGKFLKYGLMGFEEKNQCYVSKVVQEKDIPDELREIDDKLAILYKEFDVCSPVSTEVRWPKKGYGIPIDQTMRFGYPPVNSMMRAFGNMGKILYGMAHNEEVEQEIDYKHVVELILSSSEAGEGMLEVDYPKEFDDNVFLKSPCIIDGQRYIIPVDKSKLIGAVSVGDDSLEDAIAKCKEIAEQICAPGIFYDEKSFDKALQQIKEAKKLGVGF